MRRRICPELYPSPRPTYFFVPILPYLPLVVRWLPWVAGVPAALTLLWFVLSSVPVVTMFTLLAAVLFPVAAGVALFKYGWGEAEAEA